MNHGAPTLPTRFSPHQPRPTPSSHLQAMMETLQAALDSIDKTETSIHARMDRFLGDNDNIITANLPADILSELKRE